MNHYLYKNFIVEVLNEPTYELGSTNKDFNYEKIFFNDDGQEYYPTSKHGIKIYRDNQVITGSLLIGSGGATGVYQNSSLIDDNELLICCCDTVFCIALPTLDLKWKTKADWATCFRIFKQDNDYIVHGETQISKLDRGGNIKWEFGGADIFVSLDNEEVFTIENDGISLIDFSKTKYKINFDGKLV